MPKGTEDEGSIKHEPTYMRTGIEACQGILSHENSDDNHVSRASSLAPTYAIYTSTINKGLEDEASTLM